jgi:hypothetical protein
MEAGITAAMASDGKIPGQSFVSGLDMESGGNKNTARRMGIGVFY